MAIYKANGEIMNAAEISMATVGHFGVVYTDNTQTTPASHSDLLSALAVARQANADEVKAIIDADAGLSDAKIVATADAIDEMAVVINFDADILAEKSGRGAICVGALYVITDPSGFGREAIGVTSFRCGKTKAINHLKVIGAQLLNHLA
jgi:hypothetical protein